MPNPPPVRAFRTGRFLCELQGRHVTVYDGAAGDPKPMLRAKVIEWLELLEAIDAAAAAEELRRTQGDQEPS